MNQWTQISSFLFFLKSRYFRCLPVSQSCSSRPPAKPSGLKVINTWSVSSVNSPPASGCRWLGRLPRTRSPRQLQHKQKERGRRRRRETENKKTSDLRATECRRVNKRRRPANSHSAFLSVGARTRCDPVTELRSAAVPCVSSYSLESGERLFR